MRVVEEIPISVIQEHLRRQNTGVGLNLDEMPGKPSEHRGYRVLLDEGDVDSIVLWFENEAHTKDGSCRLKDLTDSVWSLRKMIPFYHGDPTKGWGPGDLRTLPDREPTIVTNDFASDIQYAIDGNNRLIGHYLLHKTLQDVPAYVCLHPKMLKWGYIPQYHKRRLSNS